MRRYNMNSKRYFSVECKCGHAGKMYYIPIKFAIEADNGREAAEKGRWIPRVKHHQKYCILNVEELTEEEYYLLLSENRKKFGLGNITIVNGLAPEALKDLPKPDSVFVGGSGGELQRILQTVCDANPAARICVSAVTLETLEMARRSMEQLGWQAEVTQLSVSRSLRTGKLTMMLAQNPVFLITGVPK